MPFHLFGPRLDAHIRKARQYLAEANLARIEHQVAAEHHAALARMYTERAARLEAEIDVALRPRSMAGAANLAGAPAAEDPPDDTRRGGAEPVLYPVPPARSHG